MRARLYSCMRTDAFGAGFDPSREADVAAAGAPTLGGVPAGQRG